MLLQHIVIPIRELFIHIMSAATLTTWMSLAGYPVPRNHHIYYHTSSSFVVYGGFTVIRGFRCLRLMSNIYPKRRISVYNYSDERRITSQPHLT